jgi:2-C-methyl-D-erythritol 4-phosphate cytidylyltransferase
VTVAVPATDTLYQVADGQVVAVPQRQDFMRAQTPQAFRLSLIERAYRVALSDPDGIAATDDCGIVRKYLPVQKIFIVPGEESNRKLTFASDFSRL